MIEKKLPPPTTKDVTISGTPQGISHLTQKLADMPTSRAFVPLANEYLRQNCLEEAILVLTAGIQRHPTYVAARMMLGNAYQRAGQVAEAKREFEAVVRIHSENVLAYKKLAILYREAGNLGEAVKMCNKVLLIDPHNNKVKGLLASVQEEISVVEDQGGDCLSDISFAALPQIVSDWPQLPSQGTLPQLPFKTEMDAKEAPPVALAGKIEYNHPSLYQKRLEAWLVSIQNKGAKR